MTREEAIFYIKELQKTYASMDKKVGEAVDMAIEALSADAVEVDRCKDCKNWNEWENGVGSCHRSENRYNWFDTNMNDYCSFGERRAGKNKHDSTNGYDRCRI